MLSENFRTTASSALFLSLLLSGLLLQVGVEGQAEFGAFNYWMMIRHPYFYPESYNTDLLPNFRQVSGGTVNLNINGVGTCIVIPQLRCFCCQLIPAFNVASALASLKTTATYTDTSVQITTCTVSATPCSRRKREELQQNPPDQDQADIEPSIVQRIEITPTDTLPLSPSSREDPKEVYSSLNEYQTSLIALINLARKYYLSNLFGMTSHRGLAITSLINLATLSSLFQLTNTAQSFVRRKTVKTTTTIFSVYTVTSVPPCSVSSGLQQCPLVFRK